MEKLIECVPNFSEGRNSEIIEAIAQAVRRTEGVKLLHIDPGFDTNRTVMTFVGEPAAVTEAAFAAVQKAAELIDMRRHHGAHPRLGATDVCPLVPIRGVSDAECIEWAKKLAQRIGEELQIPVYLYGKAATRPEREKLPDIRQGEYEALPQKLADPLWIPDYGPAAFNAKSGATVVGVRDFMLAYNVNLNTRDRRLANEIAMTLRESGRAARDKEGNILRNPDGSAVRIPGRLKFVQAAGWYIEEYGYAQVSMNLHNLSVTGLHTAFEAVCDEAAKHGLRVTGSELIGMAPLQALLDAGSYFLRKQGKHLGVPEAEIVHTAVLSLGLNDTSPFVPEERIIEYAVREKTPSLLDKPLDRFLALLSSDSPTPGGGSVSALSAALGAALSAMVAGVTFSNAAYRRRRPRMEELAVRAQSLLCQSSALVDEDSRSFDAFMAALRLPQKTEAEKAARAAAKEKAAIHMTKVPLQTIKVAWEVLQIAEELVKYGNPNALSDAAVAALQAEAAAWGAYYNVRINLPQISDEKQRSSLMEEAAGLMQRIRRKSAGVRRRAAKL
ncbi:MAG: glutamate formimidoyltransferase [candidate division KSB1 bacterium]|nr:glutamate formimidoyltransferase [candidate division KSB1 bacterium]